MRNLYWGSILVLVLLTAAIALAGQAAEAAEPVDFSGTWLAPDEVHYAAAQYRYEGGRAYTVTFKTPPEVLKALMPAPLQPDGSGKMSVLIAEYTVVGEVGGSYKEAALTVPVKLGDQRGTYVVIQYLDHVIGIVAGREIWGFHKFGADITMVEKDGTFWGTVVSNGKTIIEMSLQIGDRVDPPPPVPASPPVYNLKLIPSVVAGAKPDVKQLTTFCWEDVVVKELRKGKGKVVFASLPFEPMGAIPVKEVMDVAYTVSDFVLPYGKVAHDYLAVE